MLASRPENLGIPTEEIWERVETSLKSGWNAGVSAYVTEQTVRWAEAACGLIAGIMAMKPECIVLDEPTAMLDPNGRKEVVSTIRELNKKEKVTVILITHHMDEVIFADKVFVME